MSWDRGSILDRQWRLLTIPLLTLVAISAFDAVAVVAALPAIGADLGEVAGLSWTLTAFLLTTTLSIIIAGQVIDTVGPRASFRATIALYAVASLGCTLAPSFESLVAFRALQGIGGGFVLAITLSAIGLAYPPRLRPRVLAANAVVYGVSGLGGPALAAALVGTVGWRGVFACSLLLSAAAGIAGWSRLPNTARAGRVRDAFDLVSLLLLAGFVTALVVGLSHLSMSTVVALGIALVLALLYWRYAARASRPLLEPRHFVTMPYVAIMLAAGTCFGAALGLNSFLPVFVRAGLGANTDVASFSALYLAFGWALGAIGASRIVHQFRQETLAVVGNALVVAAMLPGVALTTPAAPLAVVVAPFAVMGFGVGIVSLSLLTLLQSHAKPREVGRATAAYQFSRMLGYALGAGLTSAIVLLTVSASIGEVEPVRALLAGEASTTVATADARAALASGFRGAHLFAAAFVTAGLVASLRLHNLAAHRG